MSKWPLNFCQVHLLCVTRRRMETKYNIFMFKDGRAFFAVVLFCSILLPRVSSKQTKMNFGSNRNKPKQDLFRVCFDLFRETKKKFGLFRCFEPKSKQPKQTELFRNKPKQTETTLHFRKNTQICSLLNCLGGSSVCFGSIETSKLSVSVLKRNNRNKLFRNKPKKTEKNEKKKKKPKKPKKNGKTQNFL